MDSSTNKPERMQHILLGFVVIAFLPRALALKLSRRTNRGKEHYLIPVMRGIHQTHFLQIVFLNINVELTLFHPNKSKRSLNSSTFHERKTYSEGIHKNIITQTTLSSYPLTRKE
jgi:hypothetical protein